ncbi:ROK family protein [Paenibacillus sp. HB172176]|uniref:ROK family protein n=1 Tax=Paenibacillus sp. HB172176 TaxID=2493690 RepID=UPI00143C6D61|nr:ROK family protein [Paenibacillus sp. HB172176]
MNYVIGVDVGGTNIVGGLLDSEGHVLAKKKDSTEAIKGSAHVIGKIAGMVNELLAEQGVSKRELIAVGVGTPGWVDPEQGVVLIASNLNWLDVPLASELSAVLGVSVYIDNDVRMYVYGEAVIGAGRGYEHVYGITLGTGIGSALVERGRLYYGSRYMSGELGHIRVHGLKRRCACGKIGCLETLASATGIARFAVDLIEGGRKSILQEKAAGELSQLTALDVSNAYDEGDEVAIEVLHETGRRLGEALSYAVEIVSPDIIVIGGGSAMAGERLFKPMRDELQQCLEPKFWANLAIRTAEHIDEAGVIGSALHAKARFSE